MMQHVMYKDVMNERRYLTYPRYKAGFDSNLNECVFSYSYHKDDMHRYLAKYSSNEYLEANIISKYRGKIALTTDQINALMHFFSYNNPSIRLAVYSGAVIDYEKVMADISNEPDKAIVQITGEVNAAAIDGLFTLYASVIEYIEKRQNSPNIAVLKEYYDKLISSSYVFVKKGAPTEFFNMPLLDLKKAVDNNDIRALMSSAKDFLEVYTRHTAPKNNNEDAY